MRKTIGALVSVSLLVSGAALAKPYGVAGCGLGAMVFGNEGGPIQIVAATLNGCSGNQTFGITSGTLGCGESMVELKKTTQVFIEANREAFAKDMSRGSGETLVTLAHLAGCSDTAAVGATLQNNFSSIFPDQSVSSEAVTDSVLSTLKQTPALACNKVG